MPIKPTPNKRNVAGSGITERSSEQNIPLTGSSLYIGANIPGGGYRSGHLDGFIDDVCIYNRALSDSEIQELYMKTTAATTR